MRQVYCLNNITIFKEENEGFLKPKYSFRSKKLWLIDRKLATKETTYNIHYNGKSIGWACVYFIPLYGNQSYYYIESLHIHYDKRNHGFGTLFLKYILNTCFKKCSIVRLNSLPDALNFYYKFKFKNIARYKEEFSPYLELTKALNYEFIL